MSWPIKITVSGDKKAAERLIGRGKQKMQLTLKDAAFQNLEQYSKVFQYTDGTVIECIKIFNAKYLNIYVPHVLVEEAEIESKGLRLFIVYGDRQTITVEPEGEPSYLLYRNYSESYAQREITGAGVLDNEEGTILTGPTDRKYTSDVTAAEAAANRVGRE